MKTALLAVLFLSLASCAGVPVPACASIQVGLVELSYGTFVLVRADQFQDLMHEWGKLERGECVIPGKSTL